MAVTMVPIMPSWNCVLAPAVTTAEGPAVFDPEPLPEVDDGLEPLGPEECGWEPPELPVPTEPPEPPELWLPLPSVLVD